MAPTTLLNSFGVLGAQALVPIVLGSFQSLRMPASVRARRRAARRLDKTRLLGGADDDDEEDEEILDETLTLADSVLFPILGSAALLGLWLLLKYVDKTWIDLVLGVYCAYPRPKGADGVRSGWVDGCTQSPALASSQSTRPLTRSSRASCASSASADPLTTSACRRASARCSTRPCA